jgi:hypothetical protein
MSTLPRLLDRILPALITAGGVTLVAAGLLSYTAPPTAGEAPTPTATLVAASPTASPSPAPSGSATATLPPVTPSASPSLGPAAPASRVVVARAGIDLPVVASDLPVPGNDGSYPLCDVAQYLDPAGQLPELGQPGQPGMTTYIYGHAREGMFLPLLEASTRDNGKELLNALVQVYTSDAKVYLYEIFRVKRHALDFSLATDVGADEQRLVLQTSEGPKGTIPKLQVAARLLNVQAATPEEARPSPKPRVC